MNDMDLVADILRRRNHAIDVADKKYAKSFLQRKTPWFTIAYTTLLLIITIFLLLNALGFRPNINIVKPTEYIENTNIIEKTVQNIEEVTYTGSAEMTCIDADEGYMRCYRNE